MSAVEEKNTISKDIVEDLSTATPTDIEQADDILDGKGPQAVKNDECDTADDKKDAASGITDETDNTNNPSDKGTDEEGDHKKESESDDEHVLEEAEEAEGEEGEENGFEEPFSPTIEGNLIRHARTGNDTTLQRVDSLAFTSRLTGEVRDTDIVTLDGTHVPPEDRDRFYEHVEPARGKYLDLIKQLMDQKNQDHLDEDIVRDLCDDMEAVLDTEDTMLDVKIADDDTLVVVGDVHGQFSDLVAHILSQQYDRPAGSHERKFLFLGDFVDRGPNGVEVIMLLFALKVEYPSMIFLTRGNHEDPQTSRIYGFMYEVKQKFDSIAPWARFNEVFVCLPLAALITAPSQTIFAAHGGLSPQLTDLQSLRTLARREYGNTYDSHLESVVDGLLWSDPTDETDEFEHNDRGCGYVFGVDATKVFCEDNKIDFICRAHQLTSEGYCFTHDDKCLTIFSAPNYCGVNGNKGAIMVVDVSGFRFVQFDSVAKNARSLPMNFGSMFGFF